MNRYQVLVGKVAFAGMDYFQGTVIETERDLESEPRYANRVRLLAKDGKTLLPHVSRREPTAGVSGKVDKSEKSFSAFNETEHQED